jgi:multiple sugar transport system substrate-binding protein
MNLIYNNKKIDRLLLYLGLVILGICLLLVIISGRNKILISKDTVLTFTQWWQDELDPSFLPALAEEFEALNPGIKVRLDNRSYEEIRAALSNELTTDILALDPLWLEDLVRRDILASLEDMQDSEDEEAVSPVPETGYEKWALPLISFMNPLFYNIPLLEEAGFDRPPRNRGEFLTYARAVSDPAAGRGGLVLALSPANPLGLYRDFYSWIWASGLSMIREGEFDFNTRQISGTLAFLKQLQEEGLLLSGVFTRTEAEKIEDFIGGRAAMMIGSVSDIHILRERMGEGSFGITMIPPDASYTGKPFLTMTSWYLGIPTGSENQEAALKFLSFLRERSSAIAENAHAVPGDGSNTISYIYNDPLYAKAYDMYTSGETAQEFIGFPRLGEIETIVREQIGALFDAGGNPEETAAEIQRRWEEL